MTFLTTKARYSKMLEINETIVFSEHLFLFPTNNKFTLSHQIVVFDDGTLYMYSEKYNTDFNEKEIKIDKWKMDNGSLIMERSGYRTVISSYKFQNNDIIFIGSPDETTAMDLYKRIK